VLPVKPPVKVAHVYTFGFHPPWTHGESVTSKNIISALARIYEKVHVFSSVDFERTNSPSTCIAETNVCAHLSSECRLPKCSDSVDHHIINYPYVPIIRSTGPSDLLLKRHRRFFYSMMPYNCGYKFLDYARSLLGAAFAISTSRLLTTSRVFYEISAWTSKVTYLPAPIDPDFFSASFQKVKRLDNQILYVGNLNPIRFPMKEMMDVFRTITNEGARVKIITSCSLENRTYAELIRSYCARSGLKRHVDISVRNLSVSQKIHAYRSSSAFIFPSIFPSTMDSPVTVVEAMASGCVVISTNLHSLPYILGNGRGILVRKKKLSSELKQAISRILQDSSFAKTIREKAMDYARRYHTVESATETIQRLC